MLSRVKTVAHRQELCACGVHLADACDYSQVHGQHMESAGEIGLFIRTCIN